MANKKAVTGSFMLCIILIALQTVSPAETPGTRSLSRHLKKLPAGTEAGIWVVDHATGETVFEKNKNTALCPASLTKIPTTAAALNYLGPGYRFKTTIHYTGGLTDGVVQGDLYIKGFGDPVLVEERVWQAVEELKREGLKKITGKLIYDETYFDAVGINPWWKNVSKKSYFAPTGALSVNFNTIRYKNGYMTIQNPGLSAAKMFQQFLDRGGIPLAGTPAGGTVPESAERLLTLESKPLGLIIRDLNKYSNNFIAEQLIKAIAAEKAGPPGKTETGLALLGLHLFEVYGIKQDAFVLKDGSGLAYQNRLSPAQLVQIMRRCAVEFETGPEFMASLKVPVYDNKDGRFYKNPPLTRSVRVKTGHLRGVNSLAGFLKTESGRVLCFCVILNYRNGNSWDMDKFIEDFLVLLHQL